MPDATADDEPAPPDDCPKYIHEGLQKQSPELLRAIGRYADRLADHKERELERDLEAKAVDEPEQAPKDWDQDDWDEARDETDAPAKATLTTKTIDGRDYYYYQWRDGDAIKSEYVAPVAPKN